MKIIYRYLGFVNIIFYFSLFTKIFFLYYIVLYKEKSIPKG